MYHLKYKYFMRKLKQTVMLAAAALACTPLLLASNTSDFGVGVQTSCGKTVMTIAEEGSGMTEAEYDEYLRDLNEAYCGNRDRPNTL